MSRKTGKLNERQRRQAELIRRRRALGMFDRDRALRALVAAAELLEARAEAALACDWSGYCPPDSGDDWRGAQLLTTLHGCLWAAQNARMIEDLADATAAVLADVEEDEAADDFPHDAFNALAYGVGPGDAEADVPVILAPTPEPPPGPAGGRLNGGGPPGR
jgi:hypothetical protein